MDLMTDRDVQRYREDGYLVLDGLLSSEECEQLRQRMTEIVGGGDFLQHCGFVFNRDMVNGEKGNIDYLLTSGDKVRFFFEKGVFDDKGELTVPRQHSLNKVGHGLHVCEPLYKKVTHSPQIQGIMKKLDFKCPVVLQSMYIFKPPRIGGEVLPHQDATYLHTEPLNRVVGLWIALEDATLENSCLWFIPGSHNSDVTRRFVTSQKGDQMSTDHLGTEQSYDEDKFVAVPVKKGGVVLIHGQVVHRSAPNTSENSRHIYTFHIMESQDTLWSPENWLQPTEEFPFPPLYTK